MKRAPLFLVALLFSATAWTAEKDYSLKVNGFAQFGHEYRANEVATDIQTFRLQRARFLFSGHLYFPKLTYMIMPELSSTYNAAGTSTASIRLLYIWADYQFSEAFAIQVGEFKPPMHRQFTTGAHKQQFTNFPLPTLTQPFAPGFQTGMQFHGALLQKKLGYNLFAINGSGNDAENLNKGMQIGTRLVYHLIGEAPYSDSDVGFSEEPALAIGGHVSYDREDGNLGATLASAGDDLYRGSTDVTYKYRGFSFDTEGYWFHNKTTKRDDYAFTTQAGYFFIPKKFEAALQASKIFFNGANNNQSEYMLGLNYFFKGHPVKLQFDYSMLLTETAGNDTSDHRFRTLLQVGFF